MGMNGRIGRAKELARIRRQRTAEAKAAGIDVTDRRALADWQREQMLLFHERVRRESAERKQERMI